MESQLRRKSLIMGILLALLLGAVAGAVIFLLPINLLEAITTKIGLSKLMVQAEPPISPSDRTLLSVLSGLLAAGVGWVLVDWLVFARAGMSRLIRNQSDDFEEEEAYSFRSTDPLDLMAPAKPVSDDRSPPGTGDARKPLSALSDIGDPPPGTSAFPATPGQISPGVGVIPPPLPSFGSASARTARQDEAGGGWLPTPGLRPEAGHADLDAEPAPAADDVLAQRVPPLVDEPVAPPQAILDGISMTKEGEPEPVSASESEPAPAPISQPAPIARLGGGASERFDRARMVELLDRIEWGLRQRRAAAATAPSAQPVRQPPPPAYAAPQPPLAMQAETSAPASARGPGGTLLDQPLHVALETLRNRVKQ